MLEKIIQFFDSCQPFGYPLLLCSLILVAAIFFHLASGNSTRFLKKVSPLWENLKTQPHADAKAKLEHFYQSNSSPLSKELSFIASNKEMSDQQLNDQVEARLLMHVDSERSGMAVISLISNIAPMLGILGTAWGLVDIFGVFGTAAAQEGIALGISKALYTTIFGLAIGMPGIIANTLFERAIERRAARMNAFFSELLANRNLL